MKNLKFASACLLATTALTLPEIAAAQVDDEIIVTATRRAESIQDVPIAVTAILPDDLEKHCLLYTSPSPRDRQKARMPSSA